MKRVRHHINSNQEVNYGSLKGNRRIKRKRHVKKSITRYIKDEEGTVSSKTFLCFTKPLLADMMLCVVISFGVSSICCGCFLALISSSLKVKQAELITNTASNLTRHSKTTNDYLLKPTIATIRSNTR